MHRGNVHRVVASLDLLLFLTDDGRIVRHKPQLSPSVIPARREAGTRVASGTLRQPAAMRPASWATARAPQILLIAIWQAVVNGDAPADRHPGLRSGPMARVCNARCILPRRTTRMSIRGAARMMGATARRDHDEAMFEDMSPTDPSPDARCLCSRHSEPVQSRLVS